MDIHYYLDQAIENLEKASIEAHDGETGAQIEAAIETVRNINVSDHDEVDDYYDWDEDDHLGGHPYSN